MADISTLTVEIGGTPESVQALLDGLPGDHQARHQAGRRYLIASTNADFLEFAITNQGYGTVITKENQHG